MYLRVGSTGEEQLSIFDEAYEIAVDTFSARSFQTGDTVSIEAKASVQYLDGTKEGFTNKIDFVLGENDELQDRPILAPPPAPDKRPDLVEPPTDTTQVELEKPVPPPPSKGEPTGPPTSPIYPPTDSTTTPEFSKPTSPPPPIEQPAPSYERPVEPPTGPIEELVPPSFTLPSPTTPTYGTEVPSSSIGSTSTEDSLPTDESFTYFPTEKGSDSLTGPTEVPSGSIEPSSAYELPTGSTEAQSSTEAETPTDSGDQGTPGANKPSVVETIVSFIKNSWNRFIGLFRR
ncbi:hypothetical protein FACS189418_8810 [Clostridia bacterium]|nr:hypothetical protein FACS189418_8810 [Clostridia bacterium]